MICKNCYKEVPDDSNYCNYCGVCLVRQYTYGKYDIHNVFMSRQLRRWLELLPIDDLRELRVYDKNDPRLKRQRAHRQFKDELEQVMRFHGLRFHDDPLLGHKIKYLPIEEVNMKKRVRNILEDLHVRDLYELTRYTKNQVRHMHIEIGSATISQIEEVLKSAGLSFVEEGKSQMEYRSAENRMCSIALAKMAREKKERDKANKQKVDKGKEWRDKSVGFKWAIEQVQAGRPRKEIIAEFNKLHETDPENYSSSTGKCLTDAMLSGWVKLAGLR